MWSASLTLTETNQPLFPILIQFQYRNFDTEYRIYKEARLICNMYSFKKLVQNEESLILKSFHFHLVFTHFQPHFDFDQNQLYYRILRVAETELKLPSLKLSVTLKHGSVACHVTLTVVTPSQETWTFEAVCTRCYVFLSWHYKECWNFSGILWCTFALFLLLLLLPSPGPCNCTVY